VLNLIVAVLWDRYTQNLNQVDDAEENLVREEEDEEDEKEDSDKLRMFN